MAVIGKEQIWVPGAGMELHDEFPVPNYDELADKWSVYSGSDNLNQPPEVYGVVSTPVDSPTRFASIDVCEVLRKTHVTMRSVENRSSDDIECIHTYKTGLTHESDITSVLQTLITSNLINPVDEIESISDTIREWRADGVYVFANTSTLPGCELGTIDFFIKYLPECFDGILLPRNHDNKLPITKGIAARKLINDIYHGVDAKVAHIDDAPYHNKSFREAFSDSDHDVITILPVYPTSREGDMDSHHAPNPLAAFAIASTFLRDTGHA